MESTITTTREAAIAAILDYFEQHEDTFNEAIEELDAYNGFLGDDRYYSMDELDEIYSGTSATELLNRAYFGYDAETWHTDSHGDKEYGAFNPNRDYFYYNGYGNLVSADYKDYSDHLDSYAVEAMAERRSDVDAIDDDPELAELFDALEAAED